MVETCLLSCSVINLDYQLTIVSLFLMAILCHENTYNTLRTFSRRTLINIITCYFVEVHIQLHLICVILKILKIGNYKGKTLKCYINTTMISSTYCRRDWFKSSRSRAQLQNYSYRQMTTHEVQCVICIRLAQKKNY